ncbi:MAG: hypothetical protein ABIE22_05080 [archaeon]
MNSKISSKGRSYKEMIPPLIGTDFYMATYHPSKESNKVLSLVVDPGRKFYALVDVIEFWNDKENGDEGMAFVDDLKKMLGQTGGVWLPSENYSDKFRFFAKTGGIPLVGIDEFAGHLGDYDRVSKRIFFSTDLPTGYLENLRKYKVSKTLEERQLN